MEQGEILNVVIIGSGPAGYTAGIYTARAGLKPVLVAGSEVGGQLISTPEIGNWPGEKDNPSGFDLMQKLQDHAKSLGTEIIFDTVTKVDLKDKVKTLTLSSGKVLKALSVIVATGAKARFLGIESENKYKGHGVSACATCDGFFFRKKDVAVVGGGSAAFVEAIFLASLCNKVYLVHRRQDFRSENVLIDKFKALVAEGKAEFVLDAVVDEIKGDGNAVNALAVKFKDGTKRDLAVQGVFVAIGHAPATDIFKDDLELDGDGYIVLHKENGAAATSCPGVFAAGDCADKVYRQAITSAGSGCQAALDAEKYLLNA